MELCNFNSLFEIFCTIYLAYIVTDNFSDSNFISTITEKILRKYSDIELLFSKIDVQILGAETTLNSLEIPTSKEDDSQSVKSSIEKQRKLYEYSLLTLNTQKRKISQSKKEINLTIRNSYQTKSFSFLSLFLALYCILILIYAGIVQGNVTQNGNIINTKFDNCLFTLIVFTLIYLCFAWEYDVEEKFAITKPNFLNKTATFFAKTLKINGYVFTLWSIIILFLISFVSYFLPQKETSHLLLYHNTLIIFAIFLPILNFIIYFKKAANRAEKTRGNLTEKVESIANDIPNDLKAIDKYLNYFEVDQELLQIT